jgi:phosphoglycolate phosphatase
MENKMTKEYWQKGFVVEEITLEQGEKLLEHSNPSNEETTQAWDRSWRQKWSSFFEKQEFHFLLLLWQEEEESCIFFYSDTKQVRALEFLDYLFPKLGLVRGDGTYALARINRVVIDLLLSELEFDGVESYVNERAKSYFSDSDWIEAVSYAKLHPEEICEQNLYHKKKIPWAYVKTVDIAAAGEKLSLKSLENESGLVVTADEDTYIMIGCRGEVYDIRRNTFENTYQETEENLDVFASMMEFIPELVILQGAKYVSLEEHAHLCYPKDGGGIYAKKLEKRTKVFPANGSTEYYLGKAGDYLAIRKDDLTDIYVIREDVFLETYVSQKSPR